MMISFHSESALII